MPVRTLRLILLALVAAIAGGAATLIHSGDHLAAPAFLHAALGAEGGKSSYVPATGVKVELGDSGYVVRNPTGTVSLASEDAAGGNWNRFERGAVRSTPFGSETVVVTSTRAEQFLTVREHQGKRTWRWRIGTGKLKPKLRVDGGVLVTAGADSAGLRIAPVAILDGSGRDVTPAKASWKLDRSAGEWFLALDLDDAKLPLPYAIDPAVDYPATQYLRNTASTTQTAVPDYALPTTSGVVDTTSVTVTTGTATGSSSSDRRPRCGQQRAPRRSHPRTVAAGSSTWTAQRRRTTRSSPRATGRSTSAPTRTSPPRAGR